MPTAYDDFKFRDYYSALDIEEVPNKLTGEETYNDLIESVDIKPTNKIDELIFNLDDIMKRFAIHVKSQF